MGMSDYVLEKQERIEAVRHRLREINDQWDHLEWERDRVASDMAALTVEIDDLRQKLEALEND